MDIILFSLHDSLVRQASVSPPLNEETDVQQGLQTCPVLRGCHDQSLMQVLEDRNEGYSLV